MHQSMLAIPLRFCIAYADTQQVCHPFLLLQSITGVAWVNLTRYVNVDEENGAELFYYFIQSEDDPRRDPVLLWLTGGDRCTVFSGLAFEIGEQFCWI
jgi:carboxypeptidase C (cathepsin A)